MRLGWRKRHGVVRSHFYTGEAQGDASLRPLCLAKVLLPDTEDEWEQPRARCPKCRKQLRGL